MQQEWYQTELISTEMNSRHWLQLGKFTTQSQRFSWSMNRILRKGMRLTLCRLSNTEWSGFTCKQASYINV